MQITKYGCLTYRYISFSSGTYIVLSGHMEQNNPPVYTYLLHTLKEDTKGRMNSLAQLCLI